MEASKKKSSAKSKESATKPKQSVAKPKEPAATPMESSAQPKESSSKPRESSTKPNQSVAKPKQSSATPKEFSAKPEESSSKPKGSSAKPKESSVKPEELVGKPKESVTTLKESSAKTKESVAKPKEPVATPREPVAKPKEFVAPPKKSSAKPKEPAAIPKESASKPRESSAKPDVSVAKPKEPVTKRKESGASPTQSAARPKESSAKPKQFVAKPKQSSATPKEFSAKPKESTSKPKELVAKPKESVATPKESSAKPKESVAKPKEPVAKPKEFVAAPKKSSAKPKEPVATPKESAAKPREYSAKPNVSVAKPKEPVTKPKEPVTKPKESVIKPKESAARPTQSAARPKESSAISKQFVAKPKVSAAKPKSAIKPKEPATNPKMLTTKETMQKRTEVEENKSVDSPPQLSFKIPKPSDIPKLSKQWKDVDLPVDILLLAVENCEFLSCFCYLDEPFKSYNKETGFVYFGSMGSGDQEKLKVALIKYSKGSEIPGGSLTAAKSAVKVLRPKAVFSVGVCSSLNSEKVKLGDVVVSSKLTTPSFTTPVSRDTGNLSRHAGFGWKPPLENPGEREVTVHSGGVIFSQPQAATIGCKYEDIIQQYPEAIAVESEGEGLFTAAYVDKVEWMIVRGVASYEDQTQFPSSAWASFASTMAVSVVASILKDSVVFRDWSHYNEDDNSETDEQTKTRKRKNEDEGKLQLQEAIQSMKDRVKTDTEKPIDLQQPFRPNPGEGPAAKDLKVDQIYVNVIIHEGRATYDFPTDRWEQLNVYPQPSSNQSKPVRPQDIIDTDHKNILVVGRPGIGKTMLSTKLLRTWAFDDAKMQGQFDVACLLKFRHLNLETDLNLQELLALSETVDHLDGEVWKYIQENSTKVLLIFDGIDEFSARSAIAKDDSDYKNTVEEKMPLHSLFNKLASGKLLPGATVISTSRPTAMECVKHLDFDRTIEILGFTSEQVEDFVGKFAEADHNNDAKETIWQHIRSNLNIFSLCYVPVNCFIICHCLLYIINICPDPIRKLPTKITEIYSMTIKIFFFKHNRDDKYSRSRTDLNSYMYKNFDALQPENELVFKRLGKIAFDGIKDGRLVFESSEVGELEDCGLLHRLPNVKPRKLSEPPKSQYCFLHLTIQEFFAAKHITDTMNKEEIQRFVADHTCLGAWQVVMQFVAGLLKPDPGRAGPNVDIFTELLPTSTGKGRKGVDHEDEDDEEEEEDELLTWWPVNHEDRVLALNLCRCIFEIDVEQQTVVQGKIEEIGFNVVNFMGCRCGGVDCAPLVHFLKNAKGVSYLNLCDNDIDSLGCLEVVDFLKDENSNLTMLNLEDNRIGDQGAAHLCDALKDVNCNLSKLVLLRNDIGEQGAARLGDALKDVNCNLTKLNLRANDIGDRGVAHLSEGLKDVNCNLTKLYLTTNNIGDQGAAYLCGALKHASSNLTELDLADNNIGDQGAAYLCDAIKDVNCNLTKLDLADNKIREQGATHLCDALKDVNCNLTMLYLSRNNIGVQGAAHLCDVLKDINCKLTKVDLTSNKIGEQGVAHLCDALKDVNCNLAKLDLNNNKIGEQGAAHLCDALKDVNCDLTELNLESNSIGDQGAAHLCDALKNVNCKLTKVDLARNKIGDQGAVQLCDALKDVNCNLTKLDLSYNRIGEQGAAQLCDALKEVSCNLTELNLGSNRIGDQGASYLCDALKHVNCNLTKLDLHSNRIGDDGAAHLCEALKHVNCKLIELKSGYNKIGDQGKTDLYAAAKSTNCRIYL